MSNALKEQYLDLTKDEKRTFRKNRLWRRFSTVVAYIVFLSCLVIGIYLLTLIPKPSIRGLIFIYYVGMVLLYLVLPVLIGLLTYGITLPLWKKSEKYNIHAMKKEIFSKACAHLRDYYELKEPFIITKCYNSTDKRFTNHDICIFVVNDELRITTDLLSGFLYGYRDLGCYAFKKQEICLSKKASNNCLIAELKANDTVFMLGYRAKSFIEKNFIS